MCSCSWLSNQVLNVCYKVGVLVVTVYAFSIENFNRSPEEINTLFGLLRDKLHQLAGVENSFAAINKVQVRIVGNRLLIPADILADLENIETSSEPHATRVLNVCFPYTSRDEIAHAVQTTAALAKLEISQPVVEANMYIDPNTAPVDLLIRTSGHLRLSDFMLWQCNHNCRIVFSDTLWPDFKFASIVWVLLEWSYHRTVELEHKELCGDVRSTIDVLRSLPPPPPFATVSNK